MPNIYQAKLHGSQLIWTGRPPLWQTDQVVKIVKDGQPTQQNVNSRPQERLARANAARGCLGKTDPESVLDKIRQFRSDGGDTHRPKDKPC